MSSLAYAPDAAPRKRRGWAGAGLFSERGSDVLLGLSVVTIAAGLIAFLPSAFSVDSWLALLAGRDVWQHGIPSQETLTALAHGRAWVDEQWLSQLIGFAIYRLGGLALLGVANVALIAASVGGAIAAARRLGAPPRLVMLVLPLCLWLLLPFREVRTQVLAMPLFVAVVYLLARDSRAPSRRVYWCLPILVLWSNLHGTATIGATLVMLRGLTLAWERRAEIRRSWRAAARPVALLAAAPLCLLVTPYGLRALSYYHTMLLGSSLRHTVTEWQPVTSQPLTAAPFFLAAGLTLWAFGRFSARATLWERLTMIVLIAGAIGVIRNVLFFALAALVVMPLAFELRGWPTLRRGGSASAPRRASINAVASAVALGMLALLTASALSRPRSWIELGYQRTGVLSAVERATAADPTLRVFAGVRFADWLLWRDPALRGRLASDARFELLTPSELGALQRSYAASGPDWKLGVRGDRLVVLDRRYEPGPAAGFLREPGARVLYDDGSRLVILRSAREAL